MQILFKFILLTYIIVNFLGCSSSDLNVPNEDTTIKLNIDVDEDASDEFSDFDDFEEETKTKEVYDPFIAYNRTMTGFNDDVFEHVFTPINKGYKFITTEEIRSSINKFFKNIYYPMHLINNLFQGKFGYAMIETGRFIVNSTVGLLGFFDPAKSQLGWEPHREDFGQTLGFYGVSPGPHIVIPIFGPSNLRDLLSIIPDAAVSPVDYTGRSWWTITDTYFEYLSIKTVEKFNDMSLNSKQYEDVRKDAVDLYPYLRDMYEQKRAKEIEE